MVLVQESGFQSLDSIRLNPLKPANFPAVTNRSGASTCPRYTHSLACSTTHPACSTCADHVQRQRCFINNRHLKSLGAQRNLKRTSLVSMATTKDNSSTTKDPSDLKVVICGGGIIGVSTAYYLSKKYNVSDITIIERSDVAGAASGKAAGFLALDWNDGCTVGPLARLSYQLHQELSETLQQDIGYRRLTTLSVTASSSSPPNTPQSSAPAWANGAKTSRVLGTTDTTAQVHPHKLVHALLSASNATVMTGSVSGIEFHEADPPPAPAPRLRSAGGGKKRKVKSVILSDGKSVMCDKVLIAMGPWSGAAADWLNIGLNVSGTKYHSAVLKPKVAGRVGAHALFTAVLDGGSVQEPEIYPRPDGTVYVCGKPDYDTPLPDDPSKVQPNPGECEKVQQLCGAVSSDIETADVETMQSCYLPHAQGGQPILSEIQNVEGAYVGTGHTCWGILNGPGSGSVLSDLMVQGHTELIDITPFKLK